MKKVILLTVLILLISLAYSFAEVPCKINYQGRLIENNVPVDGTKTMKFTIYNSLQGGDELWTSGNVGITVYNGLFRYVLGEGFIDGSPVDDLSGIDWTAGEELYLEVIVDGETLTPLEAIYAYPYAINSHLLEGATKEYFINTSVETQKKDGGLNIIGNVGIGTTGPGAKLDVAGTTYLQKLLTTGNNIYSSADPRAADIVIGSSAGTRHDSSIMFWSASSASRLLSQGNNVYLSVWNQDAITGSNVKLAANSGGTSWFKGNVGIGTTEPDATLDVDGTVSIFGSWTTTDSLGKTLVKDAIYKATTDGIVCATVMRTTNNAYINAYSGPDSTSPYPEAVLTQGLPLGYSRYAAVTLPVKKDDYWRIYVLEGTPVIRWLPMGSGTCVRQ